MEQIFVYGTLKRNYSNYRVIERSNGVFRGECSLPGFQLFDLGYFPGALVGNGTIHGEVFNVDSLEELDALEGYPTFYDRMKVQTKYGQAWVYYLDSVGRSDSIISSGKWEGA